jgi:hypothetical protein
VPLHTPLRARSLSREVYIAPAYLNRPVRDRANSSGIGLQEEGKEEGEEERRRGGRALPGRESSPGGGEDRGAAITRSRHPDSWKETRPHPRGKYKASKHRS